MVRRGRGARGRETREEEDRRWICRRRDNVTSLKRNTPLREGFPRRGVAPIRDVLDVCDVWAV